MSAKKDRGEHGGVFRDAYVYMPLRGVQSFNRSVTREELTETVNRINAGIQGNR